MPKSRLYRFFVLPALLAFFQTIHAQVPSQPAQIADRMGIYAWGFESSAYQAQTSGQIDRLNWAADKVAEVGTRTIRLTLPGVVYGLPVAGDLAQTASSAAYDNLFSDPRFKTVLLTVTTTGAFIDTVYPWADGFTQTEYDATRAEIAKLGDALLGNPKYAGKTFIILNWEADNEIILYKEKQTIWDAFVNWTNARADGVRDARSRNQNSQAKLFSGFEFNLVRARETNLPCGTPVSDPIREDPLKNRCAVDYIAPRVNVDYYSYSSWQTMEVKVADRGASYKEAIKRDLQFALARVRERRPEIEERNFLLGEFGMPRMQWSEKTVADFVNEMIDAVTAPDGFQVSYAVFWQIIDNLSFNIVWNEGFGLFTSRHGMFYLNLVGDVFKKRLAGQMVAPHEGGPFIRQSPPGVVNAATGSGDLQVYPNSRIEIFADGNLPFTAAGNRVNIEQMLNHFLIAPASAPDFAESTVKISATLPKGIRPGPAMVQVYDGNRVESQGQYVNFNCAACPVISEVIDSEKQVGEFHPGTMVTITGSNFLPAGNRVIVEQQDLTARKLQFVVPPEDVVEESANQIKLRLPRNLIFTKFTFVVVAGRDGLESSLYPLREWPYEGIVPECTSCAPAISIKSAIGRGIVTRDGGTENFLPRSVVTIRGDRFSATGNSMIIEQGGQRYSVEKDSDWSESPARINATLPVALQAGRAIVYVVNAGGQESKAQPITIARGLPIVRKPIRCGDGRKVGQ